MSPPLWRAHWALALFAARAACGVAPGYYMGAVSSPFNSVSVTIASGTAVLSAPQAMTVDVNGNLFACYSYSRDGYSQYVTGSRMSGFAIGAVPEASGEIRKLVIDGAPDLVRMGSDEILGMVPGYRASLEQELYPVIDEVCAVVASAAVTKLKTQAGDPGATYSSSEALQAGADAAVARVDAILEDAMDLPDVENDNITPRQQRETKQ